MFLSTSDKPLREVLPQYPKVINNVRVVIDDVEYLHPSETDVRYIQSLVNKDNTWIERIKIYDSDRNGEYLMIFREDGKFLNEFTSNFYVINSDLAFEIF